LEGPIRDIVIIGSAQKVEHYEMAAYESMINCAKFLGEKEVARLLKQTFKEERATEKKLSRLALYSLEEAEEDEEDGEVE
jgi:ferritin-like metal-binding protein YciE